MKIKILNTCIKCGACSNINPIVFEMRKSVIIHSTYITGNERDCRQAEKACPTKSIVIIY